MVWDTEVIAGTTLFELIAFVFVIVLGIIFGRLVQMGLKKIFLRYASKSTSKGLARLVYYLIVSVSFYIAFWYVLGLDFSALLVSLGVLGIAIAFASQQIVQNAFAGLLFSITRPMLLEDWVEVGGSPVTGLCRVKDITLLHTVLRDLDGRILYIPNAFIMNNKLINYTKGGFIAVESKLFLNPASDLDKVRKMVLNLADEHPDILPNLSNEEGRSAIRSILKNSNIIMMLENKGDLSFLNPQVNIIDIQRSKLTISIKIWIREVNRKDTIMSSFLASLKDRLSSEGIQLEDG